VLPDKNKPEDLLRMVWRWKSVVIVPFVVTFASTRRRFRKTRQELAGVDVQLAAERAEEDRLWSQINVFAKRVAVTPALETEITALTRDCHTVRGATKATWRIRKTRRSLTPSSDAKSAKSSRRSIAPSYQKDPSARIGS
jgi:hypothetical protein